MLLFWCFWVQRFVSIIGRSRCLLAIIFTLIKMYDVVLRLMVWRYRVRSDVVVSFSSRTSVFGCRMLCVSVVTNERNVTGWNKAWNEDKAWWDRMTNYGVTLWNSKRFLRTLQQNLREYFLLYPVSACSLLVCMSHICHKQEEKNCSRKPKSNGRVTCNCMAEKDQGKKRSWMR